MLTRKAAEGIEYQTCAMCECSMSITQETISNAFEYAGRLAHVKQPQELAHVQSDFISRQAQVVGERTREFAQSMAKANETSANTFREIGRSDSYLARRLISPFIQFQASPICV
jgi:hypothetical protein